MPGAGNAHEALGRLGQAVQPLAERYRNNSVVIAAHHQHWCAVTLLTRKSERNWSFMKSRKKGFGATCAARRACFCRNSPLWVREDHQLNYALIAGRPLRPVWFLLTSHHASYSAHGDEVGLICVKSLMPSSAMSREISVESAARSRAAPGSPRSAAKKGGGRANRCPADFVDAAVLRGAGIPSGEKSLDHERVPRECPVFPLKICRIIAPCPPRAASRRPG